MRRLVFFFVVLMPVLLFAQPRVDGNKPLTIIKVSQAITNPVGWAFEDYPSQKWCGYYGVIYDGYKNNSKTPINPNISSISDAYFNSTNNHSVLSMQMKKTMIDTTTCYLLYVKRYWVDWDYPTIHRGRHNYKEFAIYVLSSSEYEKLWNIDSADSTVTKITFNGDVSYSSNYFEGCKNEKAALTVLNDVRYLTIQRYEESYFYLKKEDDNTIRFYPPTSHSMVGERQQAYWDFQIDLSKTYFEVSTATFNKLKIQ